MEEQEDNNLRMTDWDVIKAPVAMNDMNERAFNSSSLTVNKFDSKNDFKIFTL